MEMMEWMSYYVLRNPIEITVEGVKDEKRMK